MHFVEKSLIIIGDQRIQLSIFALTIVIKRTLSPKTNSQCRGLFKYKIARTSRLAFYGFN